MRSSQASIGRLATSLREKRLAREEKPKMKLTLRQRLRNWLMAEPEEELELERSFNNNDDEDFHIDHDSAIHFSVVPAAGGKIVQIRYYDRVKDRNLTKLHVITPDEKLEEALAHIFQIEVLSR